MLLVEQFRVRDERQRRIVGDGDVVTGVQVWPLLMLGIKCDPNVAGITAKPDSKAAEGEEDPDDEDAEEVAVTCAPELGMLVEHDSGWPTSYRRGHPEDDHEAEP